MRRAEADDFGAASYSARMDASIEPAQRPVARKRDSYLKLGFLSRKSSGNSLLEGPLPSRQQSKGYKPNFDYNPENATSLTGLNLHAEPEATTYEMLGGFEESTQLRFTRIPPTPVNATSYDDRMAKLGAETPFVHRPRPQSCHSISFDDTESIYSRSRASSTCSRPTSIYSVDESGSEEFEEQLRKEERTTLAKKAAMFKNSRLSPNLPTFSTSLATWSIVCHAAKSSNDCYYSLPQTEQGIHVSADSSKDYKAITIDEHVIDGSRVLFVSIRGTQFQSLSDWAANADGKSIKPTGFLDDGENLCHSGFLRVAKAMVEHVSLQIQRHPAYSERPALLLTGHSAGGAVAALLYSHMLSNTVKSGLTALSSQFSTIHCITFGAPPVSLHPLQTRSHRNSVFLTFANEGDPVVRVTHPSYVKSLAKLLTTSTPACLAASLATPSSKVVRGSRGSAVYRQTLPLPPPVPWEELPVWPTPAALFANAGNVVLLRDGKEGRAVASPVIVEDIKDLIYGDLTQHMMGTYLRRVKDLAYSAMIGRVSL